MKWLIGASCILLFGCAGANLVQSPVASQSEYAPVNENQRVGKVSYRVFKNANTNQESRAEAYRKMYDSCNGPYEIVSESENQKTYNQGGAITRVGSVIYDDNTTLIKTYNNIEFRCVRKTD